MLYLPPMSQLSTSWQEILSQKIYQLNIIDKKLYDISLKKTIFPNSNQIFAALKSKNPDQIKVVIIGQDPYHGPGQANGIAFAVADNGIAIPPSLYNIYSEIILNNCENGDNKKQQFIENCKNADSNQRKKIIYSLHHKMINRWPDQGVLLLNTSLTVLANCANSLAHVGWQAITSYLLETVSIKNQHCVFMLWGNYAKALQKHIQNQDQHLILTAAHPSALSAHRGFFACKHFIKANNFLSANGVEPINWII
jgi:uracil-DNA glycosylase